MKIEKVGAAILRMMQSTRQEEDRAFYGSILLKTMIEQTKKIPTMGVCVRNTELYLIYNPDFVEPLTMLELIAVLEHEVLHIIYEHLNVNDEVNKPIYNLACDIAINQMITNLPKGCLFPDQFKLPKDKNSTWYYGELLKKFKPQKPNPGKGPGNPGDIAADGYPRTVDDHGEWSELSENDKETIRQVVEETAKEMEHTLGKHEEQIKRLLKRPSIPWHIVFRHYLRASVRAFSKASWKRPNRKLGEMAKGRIPDRMAKVIVAIDNSGSVDDGEFQKFMAELNGIQKNYPSDITIIQCDCKINSVEKLKKNQRYTFKRCGRGATSFIPVFDYIKEKRLCPDVLVYLTDGEGTFPEQPRYPVIWTLTPRGIDVGDVPFGRAIKIKPTGENGEEL